MKLPDIILECQRRIAAGDTGDYPDPFPRLVDNAPLRQCQRAKCGKMFRPRRPHQRYCDTSCQVGAWNDKQHAKAKAAIAATPPPPASLVREPDSTAQGEPPAFA